MYRYGKVILVFIFLINITIKAENEYKLPEGSDQLLLKLNYEGIIKEDLIAVTYQRKTFLPLLEVINKLTIYNEFDYTNRILKGYLISKDSSFYIDFRNGKGENWKNSILIDSTNYINDMTDVYIIVDEFKKIFNFEIKINFLKLSANVLSNIDLPVKSEYIRFKGYSFLGDNKSKEINYGPLLYKQNRSIFDGGILIYNINYFQSESYKNLSYGTNAGFQFLGGDILLNNNGFYNPDKTNNASNFNSSFKWRYNIEENNYLTNINIGNINTFGSRASSLPNFSFSGIQLTNEVMKRQISFSNFVYEEQIEPGWQVELYKNGILYEHKATDIFGNFKFILPIEYGASNIELRYYGPKGQYEIKKEIIQIPNEFLIPGEFKYILNLGQIPTSNVFVGDVRLSIGLANWLSSSFSITKIDSSTNWKDLTNSSSLNTFKHTNVNTSTALRIKSDLYSVFDYSLNNSYSLKINYFPLDFGSYRIDYTTYDKSNPNNSNSTIGLLSVYAQLPYSKSLPINLNFNIRSSFYEEFNFHTFSTNQYFNVGYLAINANYNANLINYNKKKSMDLNHSVSINFMYSLFDKLKFFKFMDGTSLSLGTSYDISKSFFNSLSFSISQIFFKKLGLTFNINKSFSNNSVDMALGIRLDLPEFRTNSSIKQSVGQTSFEQQLDGIIGYNSPLNKFLITNSTANTNIGSGAANIIVFMDENGNSIFDEGEKIIPNIKVNIQEASMNNLSKNGMKQAYGLIAYERYNVIVDVSSFKNPLIMPKYSNFSFIADPNVYKEINIPCFAGGVVEGAIYSLNDSLKKEGQAGVKVHIVSLDSSFKIALPVFKNGNFYKMGIPPGKYIVWVDSSQLAILEKTSEPPIIEFEINATAEGDIVDNLEFLLVPNVFKQTAKTSSPIAGVKNKNDNIGTQILDTKKNKVIDKKTDEIVNENKYPTVAEYERNNPKPSLKNQIFYFNNVKVTFLSNQMKKELDNIAKYLIDNPKAYLRIEGHTDNSGSINEQQRISESRAYEVRTYLFAKGIDKTRLIAQGKGSLFPAVDNSTEAGRRKNSRVVLIIID